MAKKHSTGRKAKRVQKPRYVEIAGLWYEKHPQGVLVQGHYLNAQQVEQFRRKVEERMQITENWSGPERLRNPPKPWAHDLGLSDLLALYRPRYKAKSVINDLAVQISSAAIAVASTRDFSYYNADACGPATVFLENLLQQVDARVSNLRYFVESMATESQGHLQDWTRREANRELLYGPLRS